MTIKVLGAGCANCKKLYELTKQAANELKINTEVQYITDIQEIVKMGVMSSPVLAINDKPILAGEIPSLEKIKQLILKNIEQEDFCFIQSNYSLIG